MAPTEQRQNSVRRFKRELIRDAAKLVFAAHGIEGASVRDREDGRLHDRRDLHLLRVRGGPLRRGAARLPRRPFAEVRGAADAAGEHRAAAALRGLWTFYDTRRSDFELGFYLYGGARPVGLTREMDRELNARLDQVMDVIGKGMVTDGLVAPERAHRAAVAHAIWVFGLLLMTKTGRLRSLDEDAEQQLADHLNTLQKGTPAVRDRLIAYDPRDGVKVPRRRKRDPADQIVSRDVVRRQLLPVVPLRYRALIATAAGTGMRWGELAGLCDDAVDDGLRTVRVIRTVVEVSGNTSFKPSPSPRPAAGSSRSRRGCARSSSRISSNSHSATTA